MLHAACTHALDTHSANTVYPFSQHLEAPSGDILLVHREQLVVDLWKGRARDCSVIVHCISIEKEKQTNCVDMHEETMPLQERSLAPFDTALT